MLVQPHPDCAAHKPTREGRLTVRLLPTETEQLRQAADRAGRTVSELTRSALVAAGYVTPEAEQ